MSQPKLSTAEMETLEEWTRGQIQSLMQSVLDEEVTQVLGRSRYERQAPLDAPSGYRNGYGKRRQLSFTSGTIEVRRPRVRGLEERFESAILPLFARRTGTRVKYLLFCYGVRRRNGQNMDRYMSPISK